MGAPETGDIIQSTNSWMTIQPGLPQSYVDALQDIQNLLGALLTILNVALAILQVIKAFLIGFLDPITVIVEELIAQINALIADIRQLGLYLSGDRFTPPQCVEILGGYQAYERRMIGRLVDRNDPTRPAFSPATAVAAVFIYASAGTEGLRALIDALQKIGAFFGQFQSLDTFTIPVGLQVTYGVDGATLVTFGAMARKLIGGDTPNAANIRWQMAPPVTGTPVFFPYIAPKGFLIEVSTLKDGLFLGTDTRVKNAQGEVSFRAQGLVLDPKTKLPFKLYGGLYMLDLGDLENTTYPTDNGTDTETRLFAFRNSSDNVPIALNTLVTSSGQFLLQRTFYVDGGFFNVVGPGQGFATTLTAENMPYDADFEFGSNGQVQVVDGSIRQASTVYIRISAVTDKIAGLVQHDSNTKALTAPLGFWKTSSSMVLAQAQTTGSVWLSTGSFTSSDKSEPSAPLAITYPTDSARKFVEAVTIALAIMVLSRSDLAVPTEDTDRYRLGQGKQATGLEDLGRLLIPQMFKSSQGPNGYFGQSTVAPEDFRGDLLKRCRAMASVLYDRTGSLGDIETTIVNQVQTLFNFKWSDADANYPGTTILESLSAQESELGIALNPKSLGSGSLGDTGTTGLQLSTLTRSPGFYDANPNDSFFMMGRGSADFSPVVYNTVYFMAFCRNAFFAVDGLYTAAANVLNVAAAPYALQPGQGAWTAYRLFPQGIPALDHLLQEISDWAEAVAAGLKGITDVIVGYIAFLEARILELEALVVRLDGLIELLQSFSLPSVNALIVTGNGTDGILQGLVGADNKPTDGPTEYGAGMVLLTGGVSSAILDIFLAFFPEA